MNTEQTSKDIFMYTCNETLILYDANKNWRFYTHLFTWNFPVLIMITTQLLATFIPFNLNHSDSSDFNNYNFNNYRITRLFIRARNFWLVLKCSFLWSILAKLVLPLPVKYCLTFIFRCAL